MSTHALGCIQRVRGIQELIAHGATELHAHSLIVAFPRGCTSGEWTIDNHNWSAHKIQKTYIEPEGCSPHGISEYAGDCDVYEFRFRTPRHLWAENPTELLDSWCSEEFLASDCAHNPRCFQRETFECVVANTWRFTDRHGETQTATDVFRVPNQ